MKPALILAALSLTLTGCLSIGDKANGPAMVYYVLEDAGSKRPEPARPEARGGSPAPTLLVLDTTTGSYYDTDQIVFSRSAGTRGQYQFARWTERPGKRFADLMRARLDHLGTYQVTASGGYVRGDLLLDTELVEFYHDASSKPGQVRLVLRAELVDLKRRTLLGRRVFEQQVTLASYDAAGTAQASNLAVSRALDDLVAWLATLQ
jgi:cholesterol transport system auxiliary component